MTTEFKVGDKVRVLRNHWFCAGTIGKVVEHPLDGTILVDDGRKSWWYSEDTNELELVPDIKVGDYVEWTGEHGGIMANNYKLGDKGRVVAVEDTPSRWNCGRVTSEGNYYGDIVKVEGHNWDRADNFRKVGEPKAAALTVMQTFKEYAERNNCPHANLVLYPDWTGYVAHGSADIEDKCFRGIRELLDILEE